MRVLRLKCVPMHWVPSSLDVYPPEHWSRLWHLYDPFVLTHLWLRRQGLYWAHSSMSVDFEQNYWKRCDHLIKNREKLDYRYKRLDCSVGILRCMGRSVDHSQFVAALVLLYAAKHSVDCCMIAYTLDSTVCARMDVWLLLWTSWWSWSLKSLCNAVSRSGTILSCYGIRMALCNCGDPMHIRHHLNVDIWVKQGSKLTFSSVFSNFWLENPLSETLNLLFA